MRAGQGSIRWYQGKMAAIGELLSSMRFAISLLVVTSIASIIGTVLPQHASFASYASQFGPFWASLFSLLSLDNVYSSWWFLLVMVTLVLSTSLCVMRNTPRMLRDMRSWRARVRESSLSHFPHHASWTTPAGMQETSDRLAGQLSSGGYKTRGIDKASAILLCAKRGMASRWGYLFAHVAIVVICIGGMMDSDVPVRLRQWLDNKTPFTGEGLVSQVAQQHRLDATTSSFRGSTLIAEGESTRHALLLRGDGVLVQDLPFSIALDQFRIDFYANGVPRRFASHVTIRDLATGRQQSAVIEVNKPLFVDGMAIYQSGVEDGGSRLRLTAYRLDTPTVVTFPVSGEVHGSTRFKTSTGVTSTMEWTGLQTMNVEDVGAASGVDVRAVKKNSTTGMMQFLGTGAGHNAGKELRDLGPAVQYTLRDNAGQPVMYHSYMQPVMLEGSKVFLSGVKTQPDAPFLYLRIPADDAGSLRQWMQLRAALQDPLARQQAAMRYARSQSANGQAVSSLAQSASQALDIFAGNDKASGFVAVSRFLATVPEDAQARAADIFMRLLSGSVWELWQVARERNGDVPAAETQAHRVFVQTALQALSDSAFYPAPVYVQLEGFDEVRASVLQVTRSPGKPVVYSGCLLLVIGVFAMLYIRERRIWVWIKPAEDAQGSKVLLAMSAQRRTLDVDKEFLHWQAVLQVTRDVKADGI